jgi:hypothetical protein
LHIFGYLTSNSIKNKKIHIVSFDIPSPPNYGGVIDVYYKIKHLYELGYQITLHCYEYNDRVISEELNSYCFRIKTYTRNFVLINPFKIHQPMIVYTRNNRMLLNELLHDNDPILFEGLHTTYFIKHKRLKHRIKLVRMHNLEHHYYQSLAKNESNILKKQYYQLEANALKRYEKVLSQAQAVLAISPNDYHYLENKFPNVHLVNAFHGFHWNMSNQLKDYALYHGKLSVNENDVAAQYLVKKVFSDLKSNLIIAGCNPSKQLKKLVSHYNHIQLIENPSKEEMQRLIEQAQVHILPTFQATGIKLKLLHVLFNSKHIITNKKMVEGTGLAEFVQVADSAAEMINALNNLLPHTTAIDLEKRQAALHSTFNNEINASKIDSIIQNLLNTAL